MSLNGARVIGIARFPVKSMSGERIQRCSVTERGLHGDRVFAVIDQETGKVASAKHPAMWRELLLHSARLVHENEMSLEVTTPRGEMHHLPSDAANESLSRELKRAVAYNSQAPKAMKLDRLDPTSLIDKTAEVSIEQQLIARAAPEGTFFDFGPLHIITTNTLATLSSTGTVDLTDAARFRANIIVDCPDGGGGFIENTWTGRTLRFGDELSVRIITPTPRCAVPTLEHRGLSANVDILRALVKYNRLEVRGVGARPCAGVYGHPISPGEIEIGAPVRFIE